ncbi:3047_t:CDS:2 [Funneliformis mosseae]|uniref:3047_t:CDS:1 n=1 Tax=Funneliformis mosseae TaxID=27381 RepID=A0A9N9GBG6_FUNMO|nr:3047_t:CDS:2 [Funneliformis mosseae]
MHISSKGSGPKTILAIGGTGTGKSTFGRIVFGVNTVSGEGHSSITKQTALYENDKYRYIDTPGFSDSNGRDDSEVFRNMLTLMQNYSEDNKFKVDIILWFCLESERCDQTLQRGANFIQKLVEYADLDNFDGNIWKSVLIIIRGPMLSPNLSEGPKVAAKLAMTKFINEKNIVDAGNLTVKVDHLACWIFDINDIPNDMYNTMSAEHRLIWNVYSKEEIGGKVRQRISRLPFGVEINFVHARCKRCNCLGDPRLFDNLCHPSNNPPPRHNIQMEHYHPRKLVRGHYGPVILVHSDSKRPSSEKILPTMISGALTGAAAIGRPASAAGPYGLAAGTIAGGVLGAAAGVIWTAKDKCRDCQRPFTDEGCVKQCSCCKRFLGESGCRWRFACCQWEETKIGCKTRPICITPECDLEELDPCVCGACGMLLGTEGCSRDVDHNVIYEKDDFDDTDSF